MGETATGLIMFCITVVFGNAPTPWALLFKNKDTFDAATAAFKNPAAMTFNPDNFCVSDDFGQTIDVKRSAVHAVMYEDMEQSKIAQIERGLHQTRTQIAAERAGQADPAISGFMRSRTQGPAVLSPGPFNGAFRQ